MYIATKENKSYLYLFCAGSCLFFMIKQVYTHPVVTTASNTTARASRTPRDVTEFVHVIGMVFLLDSKLEPVEDDHSVGTAGIAHVLAG